MTDLFRSPSPSETLEPTTAPKLAPVLTVDPHAVPPTFHVDDINEKVRSGLEEDNEDEELILHDLELLTRDFIRWSHFKLKCDTEDAFDETKRALEEIQAIEERERGRLHKLVEFVGSIKQAFSSFAAHIA